MKRVTIKYPETTEFDPERDSLPFVSKGFRVDCNLKSKEMILTTFTNGVRLEEVFTDENIQGLREAGFQVEYFYSQEIEEAIEELGERMTGFLADIFIVKECALAVVLGYEEHNGNGITLTVDSQRLECGTPIPKGGVVKALFVAYDNILTIGGISEAVQTITDKGTHFNVKLVPVH